jgi:REP element-mobilizing transposase RayT
MSTQLPFRFRPHGGKRKGAGRKPARPGRPNVPHRVRGRHRAAQPVHVTLRARAGLPSLRHVGIFRELREAVRAARKSPAVGDAFRVVEFSVQDDHAHFIIEAPNQDVLSRGMRGLAIRLARAVNRAIGIRGPVWGDRYDARELTVPLMVRNAIVYVLMNVRKHGVQLDSGVDPFSSAPWFSGFGFAAEHSTSPSPALPAKTWLGGVGWRRRGLIQRNERPS